MRKFPRQFPGGRLLASSVCFAALLTAGAATAQDTLEEIVVTAQKRSESLQTVAASVSAVTGEGLERAKLLSLADYAAVVPGFNIDGGGTPGQAAITLRGIPAIGGGAVVGTYIDDTPLGSSGNFANAQNFALDMMPYDLDRLEILRGPQGTLYGAGAMGGLVKYVLRTADTGGFEGRAGVDLFGVEGGNDLGHSVRAAVNVPIVEDRLAVRASAYDAVNPGFVDDVYRGKADVNEVRQHGGRLAALWTPTDALTIKANALWQRIESDDNATVSRGVIDMPAPGPGEDPPYIVRTPQAPFGDLQQNYPFAQPFEKSVDYYSLTVDWDLGAASLISATSFSKTRTQQFQDASFDYGSYFFVFGEPNGLATFDARMDLEKFTQEVRLVSPSGGKVEWMLGAFYTNEESDTSQYLYAYDLAYQPVASLGPVFLFAELPTSYREIAAFGNLTYRFNEKFDVTLGGRLARNDQDYTQVIGGVLADAFGLSGEAPGKSSETVFTWMASARYHINDDTMVYGRVATGYRPGGPNVVLPGVPPSVDSDTLTNYEAGVKAEFLDRRALVNLSLFYIEWQDIQLSISGPGGANYAGNGGEAVSKGFELETQFAPVEGLKLGFSAAYTDAYLTSLLPGAEPLILDTQLPQVPKWSGAVTVDYSFPLTGDWTGQVGGSLRYMGAKYSDPVMAYSAGSPSVRLGGYSLLDLRASVSNKRWTFELYAKNLTDERAFNGARIVQDVFGAPVQGELSLVQPRTIGAGLSVAF